MSKISIKHLVGISFNILLLGIVMESCSHYKMGKRDTLISSIGDDNSHNNGKNCMKCHGVGGDGTGWFEIGGYVYKANKSSQNPNGKIYLYTEANGGGTLKYTIEVDGRGNFYTTQTIDFGKTGLYPVHKNSQGNLKYMQTPIITGQCNSCHNVSTDKIWND